MSASILAPDLVESSLKEGSNQIRFRDTESLGGLVEFECLGWIQAIGSGCSEMVVDVCRHKYSVNTGI